jgi:hypothetical protein
MVMQAARPQRPQRPQIRALLHARVLLSIPLPASLAMAARSERGWVVYTDWESMTEAEQARTFDAAIPALMLAWCRSGELAEEEAGNGLGGDLDAGGDRRVGHLVDGDGHGGVA